MAGKRDLFDADLPAEETLHYPLCGGREVRQEEPALCAPCFAGIPKTIRGDVIPYSACNLGGRVDDCHPPPDLFLDDPFEKGIMGAAEDEGVHPFALEGPEISGGDHACLAGGDPSLLHEGHKEGAGLAEDPGSRSEPPDLGLVDAACHGRPGPDEADHALFRHGDGLVYGRGDDLKDRDGEVRSQDMGGRARCAVAGDDHHIGPLVQEETGVLAGVADEGLPALGSIRGPGRVPEIDERVARKEPFDLAHHREPPDSRIKNSDLRHLFPTRGAANGQPEADCVAMVSA